MAMTKHKKTQVFRLTLIYLGGIMRCTKLFSCKTIKKSIKMNTIFAHL